MLPKILKSNITYEPGREWDQYLKTIGPYSNTIDIEFLSQICYEHYDRFNEYFPRFTFDKHAVIRIKKTAEEIYKQVKYDDNKELDFWYFMVEKHINDSAESKYKVLIDIFENKTWSFPPVIIKNTLAKKLGPKNYGSPFHLIEGTHRISFLKRLYELNYITSKSEHEILMIIEK